MNTLYRIIPFNIKHGNCCGSLVQFQEGNELENALPFGIGKVLVSSGMNPGDVRGNHAHHETEEIVVALSGGCTFELDDGRGTRERVRLGVGGCGGEGVEASRSLGVGECGSQGVRDNTCTSQPPHSTTPIPHNPSTQQLAPSNQEDIKEALLLYPHTWRTFFDFEPGTVLLVVANIKYDEADYIRDRAEFERISKGWKNLGGSSAQSADVSG